MKATRNVIALASAAVLGTTLLAACSGSSSSDSSSPSASESSPSASVATPTDSASPSDSTLVGGDPSTWTPVDVTQAMNGEKVKIVVGQFAVFSDLPKTDATNKIVLRAKKKGVVDITQQTATTNAGFSGLAKGRTRITVWDGKPKDKSAQVVMYIIVKVKKAPAVAS